MDSEGIAVDNTRLPSDIIGAGATRQRHGDAVVKAPSANLAGSPTSGHSRKGTSGARAAKKRAHSAPRGRVRLVEECHVSCPGPVPLEQGDRRKRPAVDEAHMAVR
jgi:hypothetical protein